MDTALFHWINRWPDGFAPVFVFLSDATKLPLGKGLLIGFAVLCLFLGPSWRRALLLSLAAVLLANGMTDVLKAALRDLRPCVELADVTLRVGRLTSFGTASAHSANMAAVAAIFWAQTRWKGSFWIVIAFLTGLSRIYVGVHYPSQVLRGWLCGLFAALIILKTYEAILSIRQKRHESKSETAPA